MTLSWLGERHSLRLQLVRKTPGRSIWVAVPPQGHHEEGAAAELAVRFASLTDCGAEPSGVYFDKSGTHLFVNILHRGGNDAAGVSLLPDLGMLISEEKGRQ